MHTEPAAVYYFYEAQNFTIVLKILRSNLCNWRYY